MAKSILGKLQEMTARRKVTQASDALAAVRKAEIELQKDLAELCKIAATPEELQMIDDFGNGKDFNLPGNSSTPT